MNEYNLAENLREISLEITENCNLRCKYCNLQKKDKNMSWKIAKKNIDFLINSKEDNKKIIITGGEPLLRFDFTKKIIEYVKSYDNKITICIITNGLLLNKEKIKYLTLHMIEIRLSIDGKRESHDSNRVDINNEGTYKELINNIKSLDIPMDYFKINITVTPELSNELYNNILHLYSMGFNWFEIGKAFGYSWNEKYLKNFYKNYITLIEFQKNKNLTLSLIENTKNENYKKGLKCPLEFNLHIFYDGNYGPCTIFQPNSNIKNNYRLEITKKIEKCLKNKQNADKCKLCAINHEYCKQPCNECISKIEQKFSLWFEKKIDNLPKEYLK